MVNQKQSLSVYTGIETGDTEWISISVYTYGCVINSGRIPVEEMDKYTAPL